MSSPVRLLYALPSFLIIVSSLIIFLHLPASTPPQSPSLLNNLKTYTNEKYGFTFGYPANLTLAELGPNLFQQMLDRGEQISGTIEPSLNTVVAKSQSDTAFIIQIFNTSLVDITPSDYFNNFLYTHGPCDVRWGFKATGTSTINTTTLPIIKVTGGNPEPQTCYYLTNRRGLLFVFDSKSSLDRLLSTFKFLDQIPTDTSTWKIYENTELGFEVRYPSGLWQEKSTDTNKPIFTLSDKNTVDEQFAFFLTFSLIGGDFLGSGEKAILDIVDQYLDYYSFRDKYGSEVFASFQGDPPRGYSDLYLPLTAPSQYPPEFLKVTASVSSSDYPAYGGNYSQRDLIKSIASTIQLTNHNYLTVQLYYYNSLYDPQFDCTPDAVIPITRSIPFTPTPIQDTINLLLQGQILPSEKGFSTEFPHPNFKLLSASLANGILTLKFTEVPGFTTGGACRTGLLRTQIIKTALQFSQVKQVIFSPEVFQP